MRSAGGAATPISGLLITESPVHGDQRGSFTEAWNAERLTAAGLGRFRPAQHNPGHFRPVQHNISVNAERGVTRGFHAEPWDKFVTVASGAVLAAWVDLRAGAGFGTSWWRELRPGQAAFVPRGVANAFQALEDGTVYSYLVNRTWRPASSADGYPAVNLADPALAVPWPVPLEQAVLSAADRRHPLLKEVPPLRRRGRTLVLGASGQLGRALCAGLDDVRPVPRTEVDLSDPVSVAGFDWSGADTVINAAAWTDVDGAETPAGRSACWAVNVQGVRALVEASRAHGFSLVQVSSDYVFDGRRPEHAEDEPVSPLNVYGQTKAAGEALVATLPDALLVRTSWLIGDGANFVRTMIELARRGERPRVVDDQVGRLTFSTELAAAIRHLLEAGASGVHHVSSSGPALSWCALARHVFALCGRDPDDVVPVSSDTWAADVQRRGRPAPAPRPAHSALRLDRLEATGFSPRDGMSGLADYVRELTS